MIPLPRPEGTEEGGASTVLHGGRRAPSQAAGPPRAPPPSGLARRPPRGAMARGAPPRPAAGGRAAAVLPGGWRGARWAGGGAALALLVVAGTRRGGGGEGAGEGGRRPVFVGEWRPAQVSAPSAPSRVRECPGGTECGEHGFCDFRWGACVCDFGWKGPGCGAKVAPACTVNEGEQYRIRPMYRAVEDGNDISFRTVAEHLGPVACECYRQLELEKEMGFSPKDKINLRDTRLPRSDPACFVRVDSEGRYHPELQTSVFPLEEETEPPLPWTVLEEERASREDPRSRPVRFMAYSEFRQGSLGATMGFEQSTGGVESGLTVDFSLFQSEEEKLEKIACTRVVPLHECPGSCSHNGRCVDRCGKKECRCYSGTLIPDPEAPPGDQAPCQKACDGACSTLNDCSGNGDCVVGFCRCHHGFFGMDCSLRKDMLGRSGGAQGRAGDFQLGRGAGDKIFVYDPPPWLIHSHDARCDGYVGLPNYSANVRFIQRLLRDPARRAVIPEDAGAFLVPLLPFSYNNWGNTRTFSLHALQVLGWVRDTHGEFLERSGGHDHVMFFVGDRHSCDLDPALANLTHLVHFGYEGDTEPWAKENIYDPQEPRPCFRPGTDVVFAPYEERAREWFKALPEKIKPSLRDAQENLLFFRGALEYAGDSPGNVLRCAMGAGDPAVAFSPACLATYAMGVRYGVFHHNQGKPGVRIYAPHQGHGVGKEYSDYLSETVFALAPLGTGFGMRIVAAVMHGAIPVFLEHNYHQAWSDVVDPAEYGFVGDITDIPDLVEKLRAVPAAELDAKFQRILEIAPAFVWEEPDGQAYAYALRAVDQVMAGKRARGDLPV